MEICVIIFLRHLDRAVMSQSVHRRDSGVAEAARQAGRFPFGAKFSLPGIR
jgi:hypothetical protein